MKIPYLRIILLLTLFAMGLIQSHANSFPNRCSNDKNPNEFTILSYHEIADKNAMLDSTFTVSPANFTKQIEWLVENNYHFINVDDILNYRLKGKPLPDNAVLITFDDGYQSVYSNAFPIIKKYHIPVVIALVGTWEKSIGTVDYDGPLIERDKFLSQKEIKEMIASGLVEIASHSYGMHKGIMGNPQGNMQPSATTHLWDPKTGTYENDKHYEQRVYDDLTLNNSFLKEYTGQKPRVIVWPYGRYNTQSKKMAEKAGMPLGLTLDDGSNTKITPLWGLRRILVDGSMTIKDLKVNMWMRNANLTDDGRTTKAAHIDLDYIYDPDPVQQDHNLNDLINRIIKLGINTVYLQAFADPDGNGAANYVYFPNRHLPVKADLFNRVAWQISTRTRVKRVYAWMPMIAWELPSKHFASNDKVITLSIDKSHLNMGYPRLSPFSKNAQKVIKEVYEDLGKSSYFDGVIFHDDVTLSDYEDDSEFARAQYTKWNLPRKVSDIRKNHQEFLRWTRLKTSYLDKFAGELSQILKSYQPQLKTARNLYAQVALNNDAQEWYSQSLSESIKNYDYTAIMAMPYMEEASNTREFYAKIVSRVKEQECGLEKTVMELQTVDWRKGDEPISPNEMAETIGYLYELGVNHIAYYPDNVFKNNPEAEMIRKSFLQKPIRMINTSNF